MIAFEGAEGALKVVLDLGAVTEEVFVEQVLGVVGVGLEHAEGEALVGVRVGFGMSGLSQAVRQMRFVHGMEPAAFGAGEALRDPMTMDEALDENLLGGVLRLQVLENGLLEGFVSRGVLEGQQDGLGGEPVFEGIEPDFGFAGRGAGAGGLLSIAAVGRDLFGCRHGSPPLLRVAGGGKVFGVAGVYGGGEVV